MVMLMGTNFLSVERVKVMQHTENLPLNLFALLENYLFHGQHLSLLSLMVFNAFPVIRIT